MSYWVKVNFSPRTLVFCPPRRELAQSLLYSFVVSFFYTPLWLTCHPSLLFFPHALLLIVTSHNVWPNVPLGGVLLDSLLFFSCAHCVPHPSPSPSHSISSTHCRWLFSLPYFLSNYRYFSYACRLLSIVPSQSGSIDVSLNVVLQSFSAFLIHSLSPAQHCLFTQASLHTF